MKILCVEDGSIDLDENEEKLKDLGYHVLVYRAGAEKPFILECDGNSSIYEKIWNKIIHDFEVTVSEEDINIPTMNKYSMRRYLENIAKDYLEKELYGANGKLIKEK